MFTTTRVQWYMYTWQAVAVAIYNVYTGTSCKPSVYMYMYVHVHNIHVPDCSMSNSMGVALCWLAWCWTASWCQHMHLQSGAEMSPDTPLGVGHQLSLQCDWVVYIHMYAWMGKELKSVNCFAKAKMISLSSISYQFWWQIYRHMYKINVLLFLTTMYMYHAGNIMSTEWSLKAVRVVKVISL